LHSPGQTLFASYPAFDLSGISGPAATVTLSANEEATLGVVNPGRGIAYRQINHKAYFMSHQPAEDTVLAFIDAMNKEDFKTARDFVTPGMDFIGVMGSRHGADAYFSDMEKMKFKYDIKKAFVDDKGNDVCLWYDINMGKKTITSSGWYHLVDGKISEFKVLFDPRPLL